VRLGAAAALTQLTTSCVIVDNWIIRESPGYVGNEPAMRRALAAARQCGMRRAVFRRAGSSCGICEPAKAAVLLPILSGLRRRATACGAGLSRTRTILSTL
jgi:hypothetical protein